MADNERLSLLAQGVPAYGDKDEDWVEYLKELQKKGMEGNKNLYSEWTSNEAYLQGGEEQFHELNQPRGRIRLLSTPRGATRVAFNRVDPLVMNQIQRMTERRPAFSVIPVSTSYQDVMTAKIGKRVLDFYWDNRLPVTLRGFQAAMSMLKSGRGPVALDWASTGKTAMVKVKDLPKKVRSKFTGQDQEAVPLGKLVLRKVEPRNFLIDPLANDIHDEPRAQWVMEWRVSEIDYLTERTGYKSDLKADPFYPQGDDVRVEDAFQTYGSGIRSDEAQFNHSVVETVFRHLPLGDKLPNGIEIVMASGKVLSKRPFEGYGPPGEKVLPYAAMAYRPPLQGFWVKSFIKDLKGPQRWRNEFLEYYLSRMKRSVGQIFYRAGIFEDALQEKDFEINPHKAVAINGNPGDIFIPQLEGSMANLEQALQFMNGEMEDISGIHRISRGEAEFSGMPAALGAMLQASDRSQFGPVVLLNELLFYQPLAKLILYMLAENHSEAEVLAGPEVEKEDAFVFEGGMLERGRFDVRVEPGSTYPQNEVLEKQQIKDEYMSGLYGTVTDPAVRRMTLRLLKRPVPIAEADNEAIQEELAKTENRKLRAGKLVPVNAYDIPTTHLVSHLNDWAKAGMEKTKDHKRDAAFMVHCNQHRSQEGLPPLVVPGGLTEHRPDLAVKSVLGAEGVPPGAISPADVGVNLTGQGGPGPAGPIPQPPGPEGLVPQTPGPGQIDTGNPDLTGGMGGG